MGEWPFDSEAVKSMTAHWTRAQPTVAAFVQSLVRNSHDADELLQQTAERVVERYHQFDTSRPFLPWAMTIAKHCVIDHARRQGRAATPLMLGEAAERVAEAFAHEEVDTALMQRLERCLKELAPRAREAIGLRYTNEWKPKRIAEHLGMTANAATVMLHRARAMLRACLEATSEAGEVSR